MDQGSSASLPPVLRYTNDMSDLRSVPEMQHALASKKISAVELLEEARQRIDRDDSRVQAFISLTDHDDLTKIAQQIDKRRARGDENRQFAGIPIAIKDNIAVAGQRLTAGSKMLEHYTSPYSATAVEHLEAAGLLIVGKTNMDEFGFGSSTENSAFHPTRNPRDLTRVPGGTSGGSAAAVAAGFVPWALGTDTGGSIRQPAALCGVAGIRPTYGRVSRYGLVAYASSMDQIGPIAGTVKEARSLLGLIAGADDRDSTSVREPFIEQPESQHQYKIGVPREYLSEGCQPAIVRAIREVAELAEGLGWSVQSISLPLTEYALAIYYVISSVEAASNLARYDGLIYGHHPHGANSWGEYVDRARAEGFGNETKRRIILGTFAASEGYQDKYYIRACQARAKIAQEFKRAFASVDLLLTPISPTTAWPLGERTSDPMRMYLSDIYSVPASLGGLPCVTFPAGTDEQGLPVGVQLCGPYGSDMLVTSASTILAPLASVPLENGLQYKADDLDR